MAENNDIIVERKKQRRSDPVFKNKKTPAAGEKKEKKFFGDKKRLIIILAAVFLLAVLLVLILNAVTGGGTFELRDADISSASFRSVSPFDDGAVVLTDNFLIYVDGRGRETSKQVLNYSDPVAYTEYPYVLVIDKGGSNMLLQKKGKTAYSGAVQGSNLVCGAVCKKGVFAYSVDSYEGAQSHIYVRKSSGETLSDVSVLSDYVISLAVSSNGKNLCYGAVNVSNASMKAVIGEHSVKNGSEEYKLYFEDSCPLSVAFSDSSALALLDNSYVRIDKNGSAETLLEYTPEELGGFSVSPDGVSSVVTYPYGNNSKPVMTVFSSGGDKKYDTNFDQQTVDIGCCEKYSAIAFRRDVYIIDKGGSLCGSAAFEEDVLSVGISGKSVYVMTVGGLYRFGATEHETFEIEEDKEPEVVYETQVAIENETEATTEGEYVVPVPNDKYISEGGAVYEDPAAPEVSENESA